MVAHFETEARVQTVLVVLDGNLLAIKDMVLGLEDTFGHGQVIELYIAEVWVSCGSYFSRPSS